MLYDTIMVGADISASPVPTGVYQALWASSAPMAINTPEEHPRAFNTPLGEWFDEDFDLVGPQGEAFTDGLLAKIEAIDTRVRKRRALDDESHRTFVRKLAANGYRAFRHFDPPVVAVRRKKSGGYTGRAWWLNGRAMERETSLLQRAGLIDINRGEQGVASTTYRVTDTFMLEAMKARLTDGNLIHRLPKDRLVRIYKTNSESGELVDLPVAEETQRWIESIDDYNGFIATQRIGIDLSKAEADLLTARMNDDRKKGVPTLFRPDLVRTSLFRQFNNGSLEAGGRLYGAWWINCPKDLRSKITINGEPTVELDFSGCAIQMLYHENKQKCEGDPYFLDAIDACERENGLPKAHFREAVKRMTQALINGREGGQAQRAKLTSNHTFKPYFTRMQVMAMIMAKHAGIAQTFQSGAWARLQRADSDIALDVITRLKERRVACLPVHDSFVVSQSNEELLRKQMRDCYFDKFSFYPEIKEIKL